MKIVHFLKAHNITPPGKDAVVIAFPFHLSSGDEAPDEEMQQTSDYRILVTISDTKVLEWRLDEKDLEKLLLHFASEEVTRRIRTNSLQKRMELRISPESHPAPNLPVTLSTLPAVSGFSLRVRSSPSSKE